LVDPGFSQGKVQEESVKTAIEGIEYVFGLKFMHQCPKKYP